MRKFYLECDGVRVGLNGENGIFCDSPTGLGVVYTNTNTKIGEGFYSRTDHSQNLGQFVCNVNILSGGYTTYGTFADSLLSANDIKLIYNPNGTEYKAEASLVSLTKTELTSGQYLSCPLTLDLKSLWYTEQTLTGTSSISVTAGGQIAPAFVLTTTGTALTNPQILVTETASQTQIDRIDITGEFSEDDTIQYSNLYDDSHLYSTSLGVVEDIIYLVNTSYPIFARTKNAFTISFNHASANLTVVVRKYWRSV